MVRRIWNEHSWWIKWAVVVFLVMATFIILDVRQLPSRAATKNDITQLMSLVRDIGQVTERHVSIEMPAHNGTVKIAFRKKKAAEELVIDVPEDVTAMDADRLLVLGTVQVRYVSTGDGTLTSFEIIKNLQQVPVRTYTAQEQQEKFDRLVAALIEDFAELLKMRNEHEERRRA